MAILERIKRIAQANITQWLNLAETPEAEVEAKIRELEETAVEAKNALAGFAVTYKRLEKNVNELNLSRDELLQRAESALTAGDDNTARKVLSEKMKVDERLQNLVPVLESRRQTYDELKESLVQIHDQLNQARTRLLDLKSRHRAAVAEKSLGRKLDAVRDSRGCGFERLEDEVLVSEAQAEIEREIRGELQADDSARTRRAALVDAELARLKEKMKQDGVKQ